MDAQDSNYLSNLTQDTKAFVDAFLRLQDRVQEGYDRDIDGRVDPSWFETGSGLDHLTVAKLGGLLNAVGEVETTMQDNSRETISQMYAVIR